MSSSTVARPLWEREVLPGDGASLPLSCSSIIILVRHAQRQRHEARYAPRGGSCNCGFPLGPVPCRAVACFLFFLFGMLGLLRCT